MTSSTSGALGREHIFDVAGLVAVITGGGTGIGATMARSLAENGATVYILGRRLVKLEEVASSFRGSAPGKILPLECDVVSKESLERATARIASETGFVNFVVANAGIMGPKNNALKPRDADDPKGPLTLQEAKAHLWQMPTDDFVDTFRVNVAGALDTAVAFLELLDAGNARANVPQTSQVLVTSSIAGFHRSFTGAGLAYTTSKAAVNHLTKSLAGFLAPWRIRVNGLAPGFFPSEMTASSGMDRSAEGSLPTSTVPLGRAGREEELAGIVLYHASRAGAYCSGNIQVVDGGRLGLLPGAMY